MKTITLIASALVAFPITLTADTPKQQLEASRKQAAEQKKDLMMVFSGSSWNNRSKKFETEVLNADEFKNGTADKFVPIVFDFPRTREEAHTDLLELQQEYRFRQLPSVVLADAMGRPYAYTGMKEGSVADYLKHLDELRGVREERDRLLTEAGNAKGMDRAELLIKALEPLPQDIVRDFYEDELIEIAEGDPEGKTDYLAKIKRSDTLRKEQEKYEFAFKNKEYERILKESKEDAAKIEGEDAQRLLLYGIRALAEQQKFDEADKAVDEMAKIAPESGFGKRAGDYHTMLKNARDRQQRMAENREKAKERGPIVSKPVAVVTDISELYKDATAIDNELAKAVAEENELVGKVAASSKQIETLEAELKMAREQEKEVAGNLKEANEARNRLAIKSKTMKEVIENHEAMEKRKRAATELEKKAADLHKQAEELREKASDIEKGEE